MSWTNAHTASSIPSRSPRATGWNCSTGRYARFGIPLYLIIDPFNRRCTRHSIPGPEGYMDAVHFDFGRPVPLPEPFGFAIDTGGFPAYRSPDGS